MNIPPVDDDLTRAHGVFKRNHGAGRQRLLETLSDDMPHFSAIRRRSMRGVFRVFASRPLFADRKNRLAAAALLLVMLATGFYTWCHGPERTAYAMDDLPRRLLEINSIYLTGWMFEPHSMAGHKGMPNKYPLKLFAERPDCYWHTWRGFSGPDATRKNVRVRSGYVAGKGTRRLRVSIDDKTAVETTVARTENELSTEMLIQIEIPEQLFRGDVRDFVKTGTETIDDVPCDVYERSFLGEHKSKERLWLDPHSGLPAKVAFYDIDAAGRQTLVLVIDHVEINIPASAAGLSFDPPQGYRVAKGPKSEIANLLRPVGSASNGDVFLGVWHGFNIDDKAVLLCWCCELRGHAKSGNAAIRPEFLLAGSRPCEQKEIAFADANGRRWHWSLAWPKQSGERIGNDYVAVVYRPKRGGSLNVEDFPLRLKESRLRAILAEVQRTTNTSVPGSSAPFSLDTLRAQLHW